MTTRLRGKLESEDIDTSGVCISFLHVELLRWDWHNLWVFRQVSCHFGRSLTWVGFLVDASCGPDTCSGSSYNRTTEFTSCRAFISCSILNSKVVVCSHILRQSLIP
jgi:hypothetical protein